MQAMLRDAQTKARSVLEALRQQQADVEANPPDLPQEQLAAGRAAMHNAIAAAEKTLAALTAAGLSSQLPNN